MRAVFLAGFMGLGAVLLGAGASAAERLTACAPMRGILLPPLPPDDAELAGPVGARLIAARAGRGSCFAGPHEQGPAVYRRIIDTPNPEPPTLKMARLLGFR
jgi:hypothetical protein